MGRNNEDFTLGHTSQREVRNGDALISMASGAPRSKNIVFVKDETPDDYEDRVESAGWSMPSHPEHWDLPTTQPVHTSQERFGAQGIRKYMKNPESTSETSEGRDHTEDLPEVYSHGGKIWIYEGHHRILASRLRGDSSIPVHYWQAD